MHTLRITITTTFKANPAVYGDAPEEAAENVRGHLDGNLQSVMAVLKANGFEVEDVVPVGEY